MPVSRPTTEKRWYPSASMSATRSFASVAESYPVFGLSVSPIPRWSTAMTVNCRASAGISARYWYQILGPAVQEQQRRSVAADDDVLVQPVGVDEPAGERLAEARRQVWRARARGGSAC